MASGMDYPAVRLGGRPAHRAGVREEGLSVADSGWKPMKRNEAVLLIKAAVSLALEQGSMLAMIPVPCAVEIGRMLEENPERKTDNG